MYFPVGKLLVYTIGGNRFCHNIGRPHKSNRISAQGCALSPVACVC
jgi:hypothetical protein